MYPVLSIRTQGTASLPSNPTQSRLSIKAKSQVVMASGYRSNKCLTRLLFRWSSTFCQCIGPRWYNTPGPCSAVRSRWSFQDWHSTWHLRTEVGSQIGPTRPPRPGRWPWLLWRLPEFDAIYSNDHFSVRILPEESRHHLEIQKGWCLCPMNKYVNQPSNVPKANKTIRIGAIILMCWSQVSLCSDLLARKTSINLSCWLQTFKVRYFACHSKTCLSINWV